MAIVIFKNTNIIQYINPKPFIRLNVGKHKRVMKSFEIQLPEQQLTIQPQENGTYRIMEGEEKIGVIYPEPTGDQVIWNTQDELDFDYVQQIGELITEHNM